MSNSIQMNENKSLKLNNVLLKNIDFSSNDSQNEDTYSLDVIVEQMESAIRARGTQPIGPLIQYSNSTINENGELELEVKLMRQSLEFIHKLDAEYEMVPMVNVKNCMYARFRGPEDKLSLAYQKIQITAFENDISLKGDSYTVFVDGDDMGNIIADVFMERAYE